MRLDISSGGVASSCNDVSFLRELIRSAAVHFAVRSARTAPPRAPRTPARSRDLPSCPVSARSSAALFFVSAARSSSAQVSRCCRYLPAHGPLHHNTSRLACRRHPSAAVRSRTWSLRHWIPMQIPASIVAPQRSRQCGHQGAPTSHYFVNALAVSSLCLVGGRETTIKQVDCDFVRQAGYWRDERR